MLYSSIGEIKLSVFISIVTGDTSAVVKPGTPDDSTEIEREECASMLMMQYVDTCGGSHIKADVDKKRRDVVFAVKTRLLQSCMAMLGSGMQDEVSYVLSRLGYNYGADDIEGMKNRIDILIRKAEFDLKMKPDEEKPKGMSREDYTKERVAIMSHYKMYIDPDVYTAEEYAFLVSQFNAEMEDIRKRNAAKK